MRRERRRYEFQGWSFDPLSGELQKQHRVVRLAPQPALVLSLLLERAGQLVTRDFLKAQLWPDSVVEFDKSLNFCVRQVRAALNDTASSPAFIETLPRRGYRFKAPVTVHESGSLGRARRGRAGAMRSLATLALVAAGAVLVAAGVVLSPDHAKPGPSREAWEAAEMGGYLLTRGEGDDVERSLDFFRDAIASSPDYARAYAGLGSAYFQLSRVEEGKRALQRSLELGPDQWLPHLTLALRALHVEYDRPTASRHFEAALARAPQQVVVQHTYSWYRAAERDLDGALEHMARALELDPVSPRVNGDVGRLFHLAGRHDDAITQCRRTLDLSPEALRPRECIIHALVENGAWKEARAEAREVLRSQGAPGAVVAAANDGSPAAGLDVYWRWAAQEIAGRARRGEDSHVHAAAAWARLGELSRAVEELEAALAVRCPLLLQIDLDPAFEPLRGHSRFQDLVRQTRGTVAITRPSSP